MTIFVENELNNGLRLQKMIRNTPFFGQKLEFLVNFPLYLWWNFYVYAVYTYIIAKTTILTRKNIILLEKMIRLNHYLT